MDNIYKKRNNFDHYIVHENMKEKFLWKEGKNRVAEVTNK